MRTICGTILAAVAGWTAWGAPTLVPAPRQMKLTGGEHIAKTTWTGEIPPGLAVMSWRSPECGVVAAKKGHEVVMCAHKWTYFCYASAEPDDPAKYPHYTRRRLPASKVYEYDPLAGIPPEFHKYVMGGEGCNWTEYTNSEEDLDWKCWTRAASLSEVLWTAPKVRDLGNFLPRLGVHVERLRKIGVNCSPE